MRRIVPHQITADIRKIFDFPKLPSATSFIRKTLAEIFERTIFNLKCA